MDGSQHSTTDVVAGRIVAIAGAEVTVQLEAAASGDSATALQIGTLIKTRTSDSVIFGVVRIRFKFMFGGISINDNMPEILGRLFRLPVDGKPISIIDLSVIPSEVLNVVVSVICRLTFDFSLWCDRSVPILLVCEEAHRYAPAIPERRYEMTKQALSRIAKEGRKYGASLCVVSQRPSQLTPDLLSQCNTLFAMRMSNNDDQEHLRDAMSESTAGMLEFLPSLGNGEAVAVGQGVSLPVRIKFKQLPEDQRPHSSTAGFTESWSNGNEDLDYVRDIVRRLRRLTVAQIARRMGLTRQGVQRLVNELSALKLLELSDNPDHRRAKLVALSAEGSQVFERVDTAQISWVNNLPHGVSEKDLRLCLRV